MLVVSDTSPLSCLAALGRLDLLEIQFGEISIPPMVKDELKKHPDARALELLEKAFEERKIQVRQSRDSDLIRVLQSNLDQGEAEAIALASELRVDRLLIDERDGRNWARQLDIPLTGTLGILMKAKFSGSIPSLSLALGTLRKQYGFFMSDDLVSRAIEEVGE